MKRDQADRDLISRDNADSANFYALIETRPWIDLVMHDGRFDRSPSGELTWVMLGAGATHLRKITGEKIKAAYAHKNARGLPTGPAPYGYRYATRERGTVPMQLLPQVTDVLIIGWKGIEGHFLEEWRKVQAMRRRDRTIRSVTVVDATGDDAVAVAYRVVTTVGIKPQTTPAFETLSGFVVDKLDAYLKDTPERSRLISSRPNGGPAGRHALARTN